MANPGEECLIQHRLVTMDVIITTNSRDAVRKRTMKIKVWKLKK